MRFILISCKLPVDDNNTKHQQNNNTDSDNNYSNSNKKPRQWTTSHTNNTLLSFERRFPIGWLRRRGVAPSSQRRGNHGESERGAPGKERLRERQVSPVQFGTMPPP